MGDITTGHEYLNWLKEQGDNNKKKYFDQFYDYLDHKARKKGVPLLGQFELTPLCNFDCKMCYVHLTKKQMQDMPLLTVNQWKQLMYDAWKAGMMRVNLTGGECLSYPGFKELYLYLQNMGCEIRVLTNGALLDEQWISFFKAHPPIMIQISLYGGDEETYERVTGHRMFSVVSGNIRRVIEAELPLMIAITPSRYIRDGIKDTVRAAKEFGAPFFINPYLIEPQEATGRAGQDHDISLDEYVEIYRFRNELDGLDTVSVDPEFLPPPGGPYHECTVSGLTCTAGLSSFDISWNGEMYPCNSYHLATGYPLKEGFMHSWNRLHQLCSGWTRVPECIECPYQPVCTNCEVKKAEFGGRGKQPLKLCEQTRYMVQRGVYRIEECT